MSDTQSPHRSPSILLIAGEASGDHHTAAVARAIRRKRPDVELWGAGGAEMAEAGVEIVHDLASLGVVGISEVLRHYPRIRSVFHDLVRAMEERRPDLVVLTDYPGFNLRFARVAREKGFRIVYHISPQVWAWASERRHRIAGMVERMLVIFPFEVDVYRDTGLDVRFVGHPLVDRIERLRAESPPPVPDPDLLLLLPGSRRSEIRRILPPMLGAVPRILRERPGTRFRLVAVDEAVRAEMDRRIESAGLTPEQRAAVEIVTGGALDSMARARAGIVASGTATVECAFFRLPIVLVYRVSPLTYAVARRLVRLPRIGMVNILAGEELVTELIQGKAAPAAVASNALRVLDDETARERIRRGMDRVVASLGPPGYADRAADAVLDLL